jgi:hypothetical protein
MPFRGGWNRCNVFVALSIVIISIGLFTKIAYHIVPENKETEISLLNKGYKNLKNGQRLNEDKNELHLLSASYCLFPTVRKDIGVYLRALQHSVSIITLPPPLSSALVKRCETLGKTKRAITSHQHSLELQFPYTLNVMAAVRKEKRGARDGEGDND